MTFDSFFDYALSAYHQYPFAVAAIALVLLFMVYKKTKATLKFALFLLGMAAFFYGVGLIRDTLSTGSQSKDQMIQKTRKLID